MCDTLVNLTTIADKKVAYPFSLELEQYEE